MSDVSAVTITAPNEDWLNAFVGDLLNTHLCASAHVDSIHATYWWSGQINNRREYRAILHTRTSLVSTIVTATIKSHPYDVPGVVASPISDGNPDYLAWILTETRSFEQES